MSTDTKYRSPRAGFRRAVLKDLRVAKSYLADVLIHRWDVNAYILDEKAFECAPVPGLTRGYRWRRHPEYPENSAGKIRETASDLRQLALFIEGLADRLDAQARRIEDQ